MNRSEFIKTLGLGASGLLLPKNLLARSDVKIYDNYIRGMHHYEYIRGMHHYEYEKAKQFIEEGSRLSLKRETENIHDTFAVQVYFEDYKLGYLAAYENIAIANMLDAGVELKSYVSEMNEHRGNFRSLGVEIYVELISPTQELITELQNKRADEVVDIYRKGYKI